MRWFTLEHSRAAWWADIALYAAASLSLCLTLLAGSPAGSGLTLTLWAVTGVASWTLVEYVLHRFVLHGLPPFSDWHAEHHRRPTALIASPTWITVLLFLGLAAGPAWWLLGRWPACALSFGLVTGYLGYGLAHHATHHRVPWLSPRNAWLARRRRSHALHHAHHGHAVMFPEAGSRHFGVTLDFWDQVFGTATAPAPGRQP
ncbi:MAG: hypothetical protein CFE46_09575 [Burkholderiales bacterium PBB6]|nr:MAG: hypothetical protein CFE46_09575 [Burkholderiales bacterium PBB6]